MKILMADSYGFCFGVKRAIDIAMLEAGKGKVSILGNLVHNQQVVDKFNELGILEIDHPEEAEGTVIITAHGIADSTLEELKSKGIKVINTTCPFVEKVHNISKQLEKEGHKIIVIGDSGHTEVKGIIGNLKNPIVIAKPEDIEQLPHLEKAAVVSQTTQEEENFNLITKELKKQVDQLIIKNTICPATAERQKAAKELSKKADLMIIIGGRKSANTKRLFEICNDITQSRYIQSADDLKQEWFTNAKTVGITAGASTPDWVITNVVKEIGAYDV